MKDMQMLFGLIVVIALVLGALVLFGQPTPQAVTPVDPAPPGVDTLEACAGKAVIEDTTVHFDVKDRVNRTTSPDINATPELNGQQRSNISNIDAGGTFQASPGDGYLIHLREDTSVDTSSSDYYYEVVRGNIPCDGTFTIQETVGLEGAVDVTVFNRNRTENTLTATQAMTTGETIVFDIEVDGNVNDAFWGNPSESNPKGALLLCDFNSTSIEEVEPEATPFKTESVPENYDVVSSESRTVAFELTDLKSLEEFKGFDFKLRVKAQDAAEPHGGNGSSDVNCTMYDATAFPDDTTGGYTWGWIDTDGAGTNIGATNETFYIALS